MALGLRQVVYAHVHVYANVVEDVHGLDVHGCVHGVYVYGVVEVRGFHADGDVSHRQDVEYQMQYVPVKTSKKEILNSLSQNV